MEFGYVNFRNHWLSDYTGFLLRGENVYSGDSQFPFTKSDAVKVSPMEVYFSFFHFRMLLHSISDDCKLWSYF